MAYTSEIEKLQRRYQEKPEQWFAALADAYRKSGELEVALEVVRKGIEERPNYVSGHIVLGRCLVDQNADQEAQGVFEQVLELDAENIIALKMLGDLAEREGDPYGARRWLERLLEVDPMNDDARTTLARLPMPASPEEALPAHAEALPAHFDEPEGLKRAEDGPGDDSAPEVTGEAPEVEGPEIEAPAGFEATSQAVAPPPAPSDAETAPPPLVEATSVEAVGEPAQRPPPAEPVVAADAAPEPVEAREAVPVPPPEALESDTDTTTDEVPVGESTPEPPPEFVIERQSDPFERPADQAADFALANDEGTDTGSADALWASIGEEPELKTIPDAESLAAALSAQRSDAAPPSDEQEEATDDALSVPELSTDETEPDSTPADGGLRPEEPVPPEAEQVAPTEKMPAITLDAMAAQERAAAQDRRSGAAAQPEDEGGELLEPAGASTPEPPVAEPPVMELPEPSVVAPEPLAPAEDLESATDGGGEGAAAVPEPTEPAAPLDPEYEVDAPPPEPVMRPSGELESLPEPAGEVVEPVTAGPAPPDDAEPPTGAEAGVPPEAPPSADTVVTETMAEVYTAQGLFDQAREVYVELLSQRPRDEGLKEKLRALDLRQQESRWVEPEVLSEGSPAPAGADGPIAVFRAQSAIETGGVSARAFLAELLAERPAGPEPREDDVEASEPAREDDSVDPDETTLLETAFLEPTEPAGEPTGPAGEEMSLASVFGDAEPLQEPSTPEPAPQGEPSGESEGMSFDDFFGKADGSPPPEEPDAPAEELDGSEGTPPPADDDEDFKAWLKSLKS